MAKLPYHNQLNAVPTQIRYSWVAFTTDNKGHYAGLTWGQLNRIHKEHCVGIVYVTDLCEGKTIVVMTKYIKEFLDIWRREYYNYDWSSEGFLREIAVDNH